MPPLALISSAAIWAPPGVAAPAIDWISAMTPILIGSLDCADAGDGVPAAMPSAAVAIQKCAKFRPRLAMQVAPFSIRLADGLAKAQHRPLAKSNESARRVAAQMRQVRCKFKCPANSSALQIVIFAACHSRMLQNTRDPFMSVASLLEPRRDLHDFDHVALRTLASEAHAGRPHGPLRTVFVSIDRA